MALDFNHCNSVSSVGLGLGNESIDVPFFLSPTYTNIGFNHVRDGGLIHSNFGLGQLDFISRRVTEVKKTYVSPNRVEVHGVVDYGPLQNRHSFPLSEVTTVTEVVKTTRFLTSTSTMERMFASSNIVSNQGIFPNPGAVCIQVQPAARNQPNQVMNFLLSQNTSTNQEALCVLNHNNYVNGKRETVFDPTSAYSYQHPSYDQGAVILQDLNNLIKSNYNMNQERGPSYDSRIAFYDESNQVREPSLHTNQPRSNITFKEDSDENVHDYSLGYDGRTHSLPDYPEGVYGCPKCLATFYTSQTFASHIQTHYKHESKEERRRRMAAKCRRKNLRLVRSTHGLTAMPNSSKRIDKEYTVRRKNDIAVNNENVEEVLQGLGLTTAPAAKNGPLDVVLIKEEPMVFPNRNK
ncbi:hypothetical protein DITRI_Ditri05aG0098000 [Diplodiscus trichospermus]